MKAAMANRKAIDLACGAIMAQNHRTPGEAFDFLRKGTLRIPSGCCALARCRGSFSPVCGPSHRQRAEGLGASRLNG
ncbi:ANTAR domain-containing protein [Paenarthrobacter ureafaciens]